MEDTNRGNTRIVTVPQDQPQMSRKDLVPPKVGDALNKYVVSLSVQYS